jgi:hypothetical protein
MIRQTVCMDEDQLFVNPTDPPAASQDPGLLYAIYGDLQFVKDRLLASRAGTSFAGSACELRSGSACSRSSACECGIATFRYAA